MVEIKRRRRPAPLQLIPLKNREDSKNSFTAGKSSSPFAPLFSPSFSPSTSSTSAFPSILRPSIIPVRSTATPSKLTSALTTLGTSSSQVPSSRITSTSQRVPISLTRLTTTFATTTARQSPARTTFIVTTETVRSPTERVETPGSPKLPDEDPRTIFISGAPQLVTVTVAPQTTGPSAQAASLQQSQGQAVLPPGAVKPVIVLGVLGEIDRDIKVT